jgi:hypothetical protein
MVQCDFSCHLTMLKTFALALACAIVFAGGTVVLSSASATTVFKCMVSGSVSYQSVPCPAGPAGKLPTLEQLNAAERLKRERLASESPAKAPVPSGQRMPYTNPVGSSSNVAPAELPVRSFRCDGRTHCSQMTSCAEAMYFLANCAGVKMDGSRGGGGPGNGLPCERQWCGR